MALDTASRRASAIHVSLPFRGLLPLPDGTVGAQDRQQTAFMFAGIDAGEAAASAAVIARFARRKGNRMRARKTFV